jgi:hypothetical protein
MPRIQFAAGFGLMFTESRVLMAILLDLMRRGIVALRMHDGLLCARSRKEEAADVMRKKAAEITGTMMPVAEKAVRGATRVDIRRRW